jgi:IclR family acetate operon transcriptional repressor
MQERKVAAPLVRKRSRRTAGAAEIGRVQSLTRALSILNALALQDDGMTLTEVARTTSLAPSTAHRLLTTMQQERFVRFSAESNRWMVGVQAFLAGCAFLHSREVIQLARPFLRRLMEQSGETANLAIEDEGMAVYMAQVESRQTMRAIAKPGGRVFMHCSSLGKAILAGLTDAEVSDIVKLRGLPRLSNNTIDAPGRLQQQLDQVRRQGYAVDDEEYYVGLRCVAAAVYDEHGRPLAAISASGPTVRVTTERVPALGGLVKSLAAEITVELGGRREATKLAISP